MGMVYFPALFDSQPLKQGKWSLTENTTLWYEDKMLREFRMDKKEFSQIRHHLGKTQNQMAQLLGNSLKAIQSFEQGWRDIPVHTERQVLFLIALNRSRNKRNKPCWVTQKCPGEIKRNCTAWEFQAGYLCWFINGTICQGKVQASWQKKMKICRQCEVFRSMSPLL
jgi:DNA-binding transcriptional regulator YiaG